MSDVHHVPRKRWWQFSLRTLFVSVSIAAMLCVAIPPLINWLFPPKPELELVLTFGQQGHEQREPGEDPHE